MGKHCLSELLKTDPDRLVEVYLTPHSKEDPLARALVQAGVRIKEMGKQALTNLAASESHQGFVALVYAKESLSLSQFLEESEEETHSFVLMLDSIFDPQNLGALLRAAECFGVDLVVFSKNRGSAITPTVSKASAGASELVPLLSVSNLAETLGQFQKKGFWAVTAEVGKKATSLYSFEYPEKTVLVMGSEGKGVQPLLRKKSDFHLFIPMLGNIDSLNVSQATAVFLSHYANQKGREKHG